MNKINVFVLATMLLVFSGCGDNNRPPKTDKDKITELIMEYVKNNIPDYESFEIIEISDWDSTYTEISKEKFIYNYSLSYDEVISNIKSSQNELQRINKYLLDIEPAIKEAQRYLLEVLSNSNKVVGYGQTGVPQIWGNTWEGINSFDRANEEINKLNKYKSDAQILKRQEDNRLRELIKQEQTIKDEIKIFCSNWEKQYLGKTTLLKCRFKNNEGNMNIGVYDVLFNDSLSNIISIADTTERHSSDNLKKFIFFCHK